MKKLYDVTRKLVPLLAILLVIFDYYVNHKQPENISVLFVILTVIYSLHDVNKDLE